MHSINQEEYECLMKDLYKLIALVDAAKVQTDVVEESLSRAKEEAKHIPERRSRSRLQ